VSGSAHGAALIVSHRRRGHEGQPPTPPHAHSRIGRPSTGPAEPAPRPVRSCDGEADERCVSSIGRRECCAPSFLLGLSRTLADDSVRRAASRAVRARLDEEAGIGRKRGKEKVRVGLLPLTGPLSAPRHQRSAAAECVSERGGSASERARVFAHRRFLVFGTGPASVEAPFPSHSCSLRGDHGPLPSPQREARGPSP
jgi:hypothetical protein